MTVEAEATVATMRPRIIAMLSKIDGLRLPSRSRRDVESILVRQITHELDRALPSQAGHGRNTADIALMIGQAMALDVKALHHLKLAALLHDIGLLMLPPSLTGNKAPYASESYVAIQHHARLGATLLEPFVFMRDAAILIAHHHERWDGSGYPYGIRGAYIPLGSRILAIADAFGAIHVPEVSDRNTRNSIALRILRVAAGTQFDPNIVQVLTQHLSTSATPDLTSSMTKKPFVLPEHHYEDAP